MRRTGVAIVALLAAGCAEGPASDTSWVEETASGVPWVHNLGPGAWADGTDPRVEVRYRLGAIDGPEEETLGSVEDFTPMPDGGVAILDSQVQLVHVFDGAGDYRFSFGGRGGGPGEFSYAVTVFVGDDGRFWVTDFRRPALHEFSPDGEFVQSHPYPAGHVERIDVDEDVLTTVFDYPDRDYSSDVAPRLMRTRPVRIRLDSGAADTLAGVMVERTMAGDSPVPFATQIRVAFGSDRGTIWIADGPEYRVVQRTLDGDSLLMLSRDDVAPSPIPGAVADSIGDLSAAVAAALPSHFPQIDELFTDGAGHLFVVPRTEVTRGGNEADVFSESDGTFLGRVTLSARALTFPGPRARDGTIYLVERDELGVQYLVAVSIDRMGSPDG